MKGIKLFYNNGKYSGFSGFIKLKDKDIFVDTKTGKGYDEILYNLKDLINHLSNKFNFESFDKEDNKQHIIVKILENIPKYNPLRKTQLSTFLQVSISRRIINEIRDLNRFKRNANTLKVQSFSYKCSCGNVISDYEQNNLKYCDCCKAKIDKTKKLWIRKVPVSIGSLQCDGYLGVSELEKVDKDFDFFTCLKDENKEAVNMAKMIYFEDMTITDISEKLDISISTVYNKIKSLSSNATLKEYMMRI